MSDLPGRKSVERARSHQGFFGIADEDRAATSSRTELQLALESPFKRSGLGMEIQPSF
jgi:hypothetical protein